MRGPQTFTSSVIYKEVKELDKASFNTFHETVSNENSKKDTKKPHHRLLSTFHTIDEFVKSPISCHCEQRCDEAIS